MISLIVLGLIACIFLSLWVAKRISNPIHKLEDGANHLSKGELDLKIDIKSNDEIGDLAQSFNQMATNLKESYESLEKREEELRKAVGFFSEVLGKVALGELNARVDTEALESETKLLGETINSIVMILEYDSSEIKKKDRELGEAVDIIRDALYKIVQEEDLSARVDVNKLAGKYKMVGEEINQMVGTLQKMMAEKKKEKKRKSSKSKRGK
jgi:HAMP domain-containing protein